MDNSNTLNFIGIFDEVPKDDNHRIGDTILVGDSVYVYTDIDEKDQFVPVSPVDSLEDNDINTEQLECKCCGSHSFTKIAPDEYECDYCNSIVLLG